MKLVKHRHVNEICISIYLSDIPEYRPSLQYDVINPNLKTLVKMAILSPTFYIQSAEAGTYYRGKDPREILKIIKGSK
jgi:hypothetical protein